VLGEALGAQVTALGIGAKVAGNLAGLACGGADGRAGRGGVRWGNSHAEAACFTPLGGWGGCRHCPAHTPARLQ
jgi:hypothetical protein